MKIKKFYYAMINEYREKKATFIIYLLLRGVVIAVGVVGALGGNYKSAFFCVLTLALFLLPAFVQTTFNVELPSLLEIIVLIFIFAAEILGELADYYERFPLWDTMLHVTTGFLAAAIGLSLIDLLNRSERFKFALSPLYVALVSFCFSMTIGVLWEFFEFFCDVLLHTNMQKDTVVNGYLDIGLYDTMGDLLVNFIGAIVFSVFGFFYAKYHGKGKAAKIVTGLKMDKKPPR